MPFAMTAFENSIASLVVCYGRMTNWEYTASLESPNGPLLEIRTEKRVNGASPGSLVMALAKANTPIVIHHNHLTKESLSWDDWLGLIDAPFAETHAHVADGSHYWGSVRNTAAVRATRQLGESLEMDAMNAFDDSILKRNTVNVGSPDCSTFYRKHVISAAMKQKNYVEYEFSRGTTLSGQSAAVQAEINDAIQAIAAQI